MLIDIVSYDSLGESRPSFNFQGAGHFLFGNVLCLESICLAYCRERRLDRCPFGADQPGCMGGPDSSPIRAAERTRGDTFRGYYQTILEISCALARRPNTAAGRHWGAIVTSCFRSVAECFAWASRRVPSLRPSPPADRRPAGERSPRASVSPTSSGPSVRWTRPAFRPHCRQAFANGRGLPRGLGRQKKQLAENGRRSRPQSGRMAQYPLPRESFRGLHAGVQNLVLPRLESTTTSPRYPSKPRGIEKTR